MLLQQPDQQSLGSFGIAPLLDDLVENLTVLVNGTPKPNLRPPMEITTSSRCQISFRDGFFLRNSFA